QQFGTFDILVYLGRDRERRCHELRSHRVRDTLRKDAIDVRHSGRVDSPPHHIVDRLELIGPACAPERDARVLAIENPTDGKMNDPLAIVFLSELIELSDCVEILLKSRNLELWIALA